MGGAHLRYALRARSEEQACVGNGQIQEKGSTAMTDRASTAIVVQEQEKTASLSPVHSEQAILTRDGLKLAAEQRQLLKEYVEKQMIPGTDYGVIPGTKNQTLLKAGAEKLVELFRCTPRFTLMERIENFDKNLFAYTFRVRLFQRDAEVVL